MSERTIPPEEEVIIRELYAKQGRHEDTNAYVTSMPSRAATKTQTLT